MAVRNAAIAVALAALLGAALLLWRQHQVLVAKPAPSVAAKPAIASNPVSSQAAARKLPLPEGVTEEQARAQLRALEAAPPPAVDPIRKQDEIAAQVKGHIKIEGIPQVDLDTLRERALHHQAPAPADQQQEQQP